MQNFNQNNVNDLLNKRKMYRLSVGFKLTL